MRGCGVWKVGAPWRVAGVLWWPVFLRERLPDAGAPDLSGARDTFVAFSRSAEDAVGLALAFSREAVSVAIIDQADDILHERLEAMYAAPSAAQRGP